jgi:hypothetical protein
MSTNRFCYQEEKEVNETQVKLGRTYFSLIFSNDRLYRLNHYMFLTIYFLSRLL